MIGSSKIKYSFILAIIFSITVSCQKNNKIEQKIIEENFIEIIDTLAYETGSFRPAPPLLNDTIGKKIRYSELHIKLVDTIKYNQITQRDIDYFFSNNPDLKKDFINVINKGVHSNLIFDSTFPKQIGRYSIINNNKKVKTNYAGEVEFSNFKIYDNKAFFVIIKSENDLMIAYIILLKKEKNIWKIIKREPLFIS